MKIFIDLDGTLIDPTDRIYEIFKDLVPKCELSKNDYWELKKNGMSNFSILEEKFNYLNNQIKEFSLQISNKQKIFLIRDDFNDIFNYELVSVKLNKKIIYKENLILQSLNVKG